MTTGHGLFGSATGSTFKSPLWMFERKVEAGIAATKRPVVSNCSRSATETVSTIALGIILPMAPNASSTRDQFQLLAGKIQGASASSTRLILRRLAQGLVTPATTSKWSSNSCSTSRSSAYSSSPDASWSRSRTKSNLRSRSSGNSSREWYIVHQRDLKAHPRRSTGQFIDNRRQHAGGKRFRATDPDLSRRRISQKFDVSDPLPEFVEGDLTATDQGLPVKRRLDAAWAAVEKPHADRTLQVGYGLRHNGLRNPQMGCRLHHAARPNDGDEKMQIPQPQPAADAALPTGLGRHSQTPIEVEA